MICITGDIHGDMSRFKNKKIRRLRKNDLLIVCGDFGFIWDNSKKEQSIIKKIGRKRYYTLFVEGCHENYNTLKKFPETEFCGGKANVISGRLMHLVRGNVYNFQGHSFFAFGGGQTKEIDIRRESKTWYEDELPSPEEIKCGIQSLKEHNNKVDYIITHEPPSSVKEFLKFEVNQLSHLHTFLEAVKNEVEFKMWYFGKTHMNKLIPPKYQCIFDDVSVIPDTSVKNTKTGKINGR